MVLQRIGRGGVNFDTMRVSGLKSHDYHLWLVMFLPVMVRGYVREHVWQVLAELRYFFRRHCAKEVSRAMIADMEKVAPMLLYKLEKAFPLGLFTLLLHMILHLPYEVQTGGPMQFHWCYLIE